MSKAYVLLSGGIDSSTCLAMAANKWGPKNVTGVSLNYGQRHAKETEHASRVAEAIGTHFMMHDIRGMISKGGLTDGSLHIPHVDYSDLPHGVSPTYVPFRNGTLLSIIAGIASVDPDAEEVYYGAHAEDAENWAYPDCTPEFFDAMAKAINIGTYYKISLEAPFIHSTKAELITSGHALGVPWAVTWSCYEGGEIHCGTCPTCRARRSAFERAGVIDPTYYASDNPAPEVA